MPETGNQRSQPGLQKSVYTKKYRRLIDLLKQARVNADLSQSDVASIFRRPQSFISKCESGERRIDVIELLELCRIYRISSESILKSLE